MHNTWNQTTKAPPPWRPPTPPYDHLPIDLRLRNCTQWDPITCSLYCSPPAHLCCYTHADEITPTMAAADAPYDDVILSPQLTRCYIIVLSRCKCKIGTKNVVLMKLWHGEVLLRNVPSQHETSPSHNFFNIGPLSSIFWAKLYLTYRSTNVRSRRVGKKWERIAA